MKLIIDIPEKAYKLRLTNPVWYDSNMDKAIRNGTPLSEELEKIKDRLEIAMWYNRRDKEYCIDLIDKRISELKGEQE